MPLKALIDLLMHRSIPLKTSKEQLPGKEQLLGSYKMNKSQSSQAAVNSLASPQKGHTLKVELNYPCNNGYSGLALIKLKNRS